MVGPRLERPIESVRRAALVLNVLSRSSECMSLVDISEEMSLGKASVYRLLATLAQDEFVVQDAGSKRYSFGSRLIVLGQRALETTSIVDISMSPMQALAETHPIVVYLNLPTREAVLSARRLPRSGRGQFVNPGVSMPYHACASGLVFMAYDEDLAERVVASGLPQLASGTIGLWRRTLVPRRSGLAAPSGVRELSSRASRMARAALGSTGNRLV